MDTVLFGLGLVLVIEGLVLALVPSRLEELVKRIAEMPSDTRRAIGLGAISLGVIFVWIARSGG